MGIRDHTSDALSDDVRDLEGDNGEVPIAIIVHFLNSDVQSLAINWSMDNTVETVKIGDPGVTPKAHLVSPTQPLPNS